MAAFLGLTERSLIVLLIACVGCIGPGSLACEPEGGAMAVGWAEAMPVSGVSDAYYPVRVDWEAS